MSESSDTHDDGPYSPSVGLPPATAPEIALEVGKQDAREAASKDVSSRSLGRSTVRGSLFTVGTYLLLNVIRLASNLILTRLLVPNMFGTMVIVNTVMVGIRLFSDVGIGPSLISSPRGTEERFLRTAWTIQAIRGVIIWLVACALAVPISRIYGSTHELHEILMKLLPVAGLSAIIEGLRSTAIFRIQRDLRFGPLSMIELVEMSSSAIGMVLWAKFISADQWALLIPPLIGYAIGTILTHTTLYHDRHDRFGFDWDVASEMTRIGRWIFISTLITFFASQFDKLIFGKLVSATTLGVYGIALGLALMPINAILKIGSTVLFPTFSRVAHDPERFRDVFGRARTMLLAAGATVVCGMIACGPFVIHALYRADYDNAGWMLQLLAIGCWFQIVDASNSAALLSHQRPVWIAAANLSKVVFMVILVPVAFHLPFFREHPNAPLAMSFVALAFADLARALVSTFGMRRITHSGLAIMLPDLIFPLLIAAVGLGCLFVARELEPTIASYFGVGDKLHRFLTNATLASIAGSLVLVIWAPICLVQWRRSKRGTAIAATPAPAVAAVA